MKINSILEDKYDDLPSDDKFVSERRHHSIVYSIRGVGLLIKRFTTADNMMVDVSYELRVSISNMVIRAHSLGELIYRSNCDSRLLATQLIEFIIEIVGQDDFIKMAQQAEIDLPIHSFNELVNYLRQNTHPYDFDSYIMSLWNNTEDIVHRFLVRSNQTMNEDKYDDLPSDDKFGSPTQTERFNLINGGLLETEWDIYQVIINSIRYTSPTGKRFTNRHLGRLFDEVYEFNHEDAKSLLYSLIETIRNHEPSDSNMSLNVSLNLIRNAGYEIMSSSDEIPDIMDFLMQKPTSHLAERLWNCFMRILIDVH